MSRGGHGHDVTLTTRVHLLQHRQVLVADRLDREVIVDQRHGIRGDLLPRPLRVTQHPADRRREPRDVCTFVTRPPRGNQEQLDAVRQRHLDEVVGPDARDDRNARPERFQARRAEALAFELVDLESRCGQDVGDLALRARADRENRIADSELVRKLQEFVVVDASHHDDERPRVLFEHRRQRLNQSDAVPLRDDVAERDDDRTVAGLEPLGKRARIAAAHALRIDPDRDDDLAGNGATVASVDVSVHQAIHDHEAWAVEAHERCHQDRVGNRIDEGIEPTERALQPRVDAQQSRLASAARP